MTDSSLASAAKRNDDGFATFFYFFTHFRSSFRRFFHGSICLLLLITSTLFIPRKLMFGITLIVIDDRHTVEFNIFHYFISIGVCNV